MGRVIHPGWPHGLSRFTREGLPAIRPLRNCFQHLGAIMKEGSKRTGYREGVNVWRQIFLDRSKYKPHQGAAEKARRVK